MKQSFDVRPPNTVEMADKIRSGMLFLTSCNYWWQISQQAIQISSQTILNILLQKHFFIEDYRTLNMLSFNINKHSATLV